MSAAVDIFGHIIGGRFLFVAVTAEIGCLVFARVPTGPVGHARAAAAPTGARLSCAACQMSAAVEIFGHMIGGRFLCAATTSEAGYFVVARVRAGPVRHARAAAAPTGARLSCAECQMSAAVDIFGHIICGRLLYAAVTAEVGCLIFARVSIGPMAHARAAATPTGARLSYADCQISAAVDIFWHVIGGRLLYAAATAEVGCVVFARVPTGPVSHARAAAARAVARLSCAECHISAAVNIFGHIIGGRFLYAAATAEVGCLVFARVPTDLVTLALAAGAPNGACLSCAECQMSAAVDIFGHIIGGRHLNAAARAEVGYLVVARVPTGPVPHARAAAAPTGARLSCAECQISAAVDIFWHIIGGRSLYAAATAKVGCLIFARIPIGSVGHARAAAAPTGARLSCVERQMSAAVDIFGHIIGGRLLYAAVTAEVGCLIFAQVPIGPMAHARAAATPTGARLSCAECQMSAAVDIFGHIIGGRFLYAAAKPEVGCLVVARVPTGFVAHARGAAAPTWARLSCAECQMSAAVDIFGHIIGGRFLYAAGTAEVGCLVFARVPTGPVRHARAAVTPTGAFLSCAKCQMSAAVDMFGHIIGGRFLYAAATAEVACLVFARVPSGPVGHARAAAAPTKTRRSFAECQMSTAVDIFGHIIRGRFLYAAATAKKGSLVFAQVPRGPVGHARAAAAPTGARLSCAACQMSAAVDIFWHIVGGRLLYAAATAEVGCLVFARVPTGPVGHARVTAAPTKERLSCAECQMSAAVDIFGHTICWRLLYAAATAEVGCVVFARVPSGPVSHVCAAAAPTGARLSCAARQMSAAVDIFGHIIGGRFLYAAATAEVGCLVCARVPNGPVGLARAAAAPTGARLSCAACQMSAAVDIFGHIIGGRFLFPAATAEVGCLVFARVPTGPVGHARAAAAPTAARLACAECQMSAAVDIFGHIIGGCLLYAAATSEAGCFVVARVLTGPVAYARAAAAPFGARLSSAEYQMSAAVDIFGHIIGGRLLYAAATAEVGCLVFARVPIGPVAHARAAVTPTGAFLSCAKCQMSAAVDIFGHVIGGCFLYAAATALVGCLVFGRVHTGPVRHARAAAAPTGARLSFAECQMSAAVDIFGHIIGGRFLYAAATAEVGCLICARVPIGSVRHARAAAAPTGARLSCAECQMSGAVDIFGHIIGGRFLYAAATAEVGGLVVARVHTVPVGHARAATAATGARLLLAECEMSAAVHIFGHIICGRFLYAAVTAEVLLIPQFCPHRPGTVVGRQ